MNCKVNMRLSRPGLSGILLASGLIFGTSCGFQKVKDPENIKVEPAAQSKDQALALSGSKETRVYQGSLLVWKPETTREDVAEILRATKASNEAYVNRLDAMKPFITERLDPLDLELKKLRESIAPLREESQRRDRVAQLGAGGLWFDKEVSELSAKFGTSFELAHARDLFARYCDGKLWELGMKPLLADGLFSVRPTATPLCEAYYNNRGYFVEDECLDDLVDSTGSGSKSKSYFACIWRTLKKTSYVTEGPLNVETHGPVLDALALSNDFRVWVAKSGSGANFCGFFSSRLKLFTKFAVPEPTPCVIPGSNVTFTLKVTSSSAALAQSSAAAVVDAIDRLEENKMSDSNLSSIAPAELQFVRSAAAPRVGRSLTDVELASDELARKLSVIGYGKATCGSQKLSLADLSFNLPFGQFDLVSPNLDSCTGLPSTADFPEIFVKDSTLLELEAKLREMQQQRKSLVEGVCEGGCAAGLNAAVCASATAKEKQSAVADSRAIVFPSFELKLKPVFLLGGPESNGLQPVTNTGIMEASVLISKELAAVGCYSELEEGKAIECPGEGATGLGTASALEKLQVSYNAETKGLRLEIPLSEKLLGKIDKENRLASFIGTSLIAELYSNALAGAVPYVSGSVTFQSNESGGSEIKGRGVASYLIQSTDYVARESKVCSGGAN